MGFLRGAGRFVGKLFFTASLAVLILTIGMAEFTEYSMLNSIFNEIIGSQIDNLSGDMEIEEGGVNEELQEIYETFLEQCGDKDSITVPVVEIGQNVTIDCNDIRENGIQSVEDLATELLVTPLFDQVYYKEYDCEFLDCLQRGDVFVIISEKGHAFFVQSQIYAAIATVAFALIVLALSENWPDRFRGIGWSLFVVGLSYVFFEMARIALANSLGVESLGGIEIVEIVESVMAPIMSIFLMCLASGLVLVVIGYALRFLGKKKEVGIKKK